MVAVDRMEGAVEAAAANGARNGVEVDWRAGDLESGEVPLAELVLVNAPPPVQTRVALAAPGAPRRRPDLVRARHVIASGVVPTELDAVTQDYAAAGWTVADAREQDGWAAALLEPSRWMTTCSIPDLRRRGRSFGQLACALPEGGLLISASRLVEFNVRATILLAPGLFRLDLTPRRRRWACSPGRSAVTRCTGARSSRPGTATATPAGSRRWSCTGCSSSRRPARGWLHILSFTDRDAAAVHFVAKAELRVPAARATRRVAPPGA